jgi:hypothetical protein
MLSVGQIATMTSSVRYLDLDLGCTQVSARHAVIKITKPTLPVVDDPGASDKFEAAVGGGAGGLGVAGYELLNLSTTSLRTSATLDVVHPLCLNQSSFLSGLIATRINISFNYGRYVLK